MAIRRRARLRRASPTANSGATRGASYEDRRDWVQPVQAGFAQDNFLGMEASDYGGGTPIVDVWRRDGGLAVGHVETTPRRVSLPVRGNAAPVRMAVCGREKRYLKPGEKFDTPRDLRRGPRRRLFRRVERATGAHVRARHDAARPRRRRPTKRSGAPGATNATARLQLIEGTLPKVRELGLELGRHRRWLAGE